ncbi:hypothetical protein F5Y09DRAFT_355237 [Xylaria sp. FL1042]|nr:hypothetical protein F5Y09DRAFT_355237 [Xylaria sp. FL1042]
MRAPQRESSVQSDPYATSSGHRDGQSQVQSKKKARHQRKMQKREARKQMKQSVEALPDSTKDSGSLQTTLDSIKDSMQRDLQVYIAAVENNSIARMQNVNSTSETNRLAPLYAVSTNTEIKNFPRTVGDIERLEAHELDNIFDLLGHPSPPEMASKRLRLKKLAGVLYRVRFHTVALGRLARVVNGSPHQSIEDLGTTES